MKISMKTLVTSLSLAALAAAPLGCDPGDPAAEGEEFLDEELDEPEDEDGLGADARPDALVGPAVDSLSRFPPVPPVPPFPTSPACGGFGPIDLYPGQSISGCNNHESIWMQSDGNLVIYKNSTGEALWSTQTGGSDATVASFQTDGNIVLYGPSGVVWASNILWSPYEQWFDCSFGLIVEYGFDDHYWDLTSCGLPVASGYTIGW